MSLQYCADILVPALGIVKYPFCNIDFISVFLRSKCDYSQRLLPNSALITDVYQAVGRKIMSTTDY